MRTCCAIDIARPPAAVFAWVKSPEKARVWMSSVSDTEIVHEEPGLVGTTFRETVRDERGSTQLDGVVTAYEPDRRVAFHLDGRFNVVDVEFVVEPTVAGARLTQRAEISFRSTARVIALLAAPLLRRAILRQSRRELAELRRLCEQEPAVPGGARDA